MTALCLRCFVCDCTHLNLCPPSTGERCVCQAVSCTVKRRGGTGDAGVCGPAVREGRLDGGHGVVMGGVKGEGEGRGGGGGRVGGRVSVGRVFFFSSRRRHTRLQGDWSSDVCSSDLLGLADTASARAARTLHRRGRQAPALFLQSCLRPSQAERGTMTSPRISRRADRKSVV